MAKRFTAILFSVWFISCSNDGFSFFELQTCGENALSELDWLRQEIQKRRQDSSEDAKYCYITKASVNGQTVFLYEDCNPLINKVIPIFDCQGNELGFWGDPNFQPEHIKDKTIIFSPSDFACRF